MTDLARSMAMLDRAMAAFARRARRIDESCVRICGMSTAMDVQLRRITELLRGISALLAKREELIRSLPDRVAAALASVSPPASPS